MHTRSRGPSQPVVGEYYLFKLSYWCYLCVCICSCIILYHSLWNLYLLDDYLNYLNWEYTNDESFCGNNVTNSVLLMSAVFHKHGFSPELLFRNVNGNIIRLNDRSYSSVDNRAKNVIKFVLRRDTSFNVTVNLFLLLTSLFLWKTFDTLVPFVISIIVLSLQCVSFITSVNKDTLIAIESIGIYIKGTRLFCSLNSCEFLPWDAVVDVFINEVIIGQKVFKRVNWWERVNKIGSSVSRTNTREKMPGIYIQKINKCNYAKQGEGSTLTVPGSYWLCYKKNIYKFIFRYSRGTRNTKEFNHARELLKVIRRIIKVQPRQGQQFSTRHLLVTYNHRSWTRQDKMFALIKFKERSDAATFQHAFVLNITIASPLETIESTSAHSSLLERPDLHDRQHREIQKNSEESSISFAQTNLPRKNLKLDPQRKEQKIDSMNANTQLDNISRIDNAESAACTRSMMGTDNCTTNSYIFNEQPSILQDTSEQTKNEGTNLSPKKDANLNSTLLPESGGTNFEKSFIRSNITNTVNNNVNPIDEIANLPYQYLIEKEIEGTRNKTGTKNRRTCTLSSSVINEKVEVLSRSKIASEGNEPKTDSYKNEIFSEMDKNGKKRSTSSIEPLAVIATNSQDFPYSKKRKYLSDNKMSRSSDITDLVMEGLMFTIRQDQDSVKVIEQKTKLEVDEVLENSEKVETKEGEKCLRNSSLLGLENLITMIEVPKPGERNHKSTNETLKERSTLKRSYNDISVASTSFASGSNFLLDTASEAVRLKISADYESAANLKITEEEEDQKLEEEDIIPEALQTEILFPRFSSKTDFHDQFQSDPFTLNRDLLMDDVDTSNDSFNPQRHINVRHKRDFNTKSESQVPRIISNQIITVDQMPLALQKAVKEKLGKQRDSSKGKSDTLKLNTQAQGMPSSSHEDGPFSNAELKVQSLNCDIAQNTQYSRDCRAPVQSANSTNIKSTPLLTSETVLSNSSSVPEFNLKLEKEESETERLPIDIDKLKQSVPDELQDITEHFYKGLLHLQKNNHSSNRRCLRRRRTSVKTILNKGDGNEIRVEMLKFIQDITRGAKVVVKRMSTKSIHSIIGKSSSLTTCMQ